jgi:hypothetical protein
MKKLTKEDKEEMLKDAIIMSWRTTNGAPSILVGHPLSYYNYESLFEMIKGLDAENIEQDGESFLYSQHGPTRDYVDKFEKGGLLDTSEFQYTTGGL